MGTSPRLELADSIRLKPAEGRIHVIIDPTAHAVPWPMCGQVRLIIRWTWLLPRHWDMLITGSCMNTLVLQVKDEVISALRSYEAQR